MPERREVPIFPLQLVAFPGERVPLHVFEPRYRKLVAHCTATGEGFGIIPVLDQQALPVGTYMHIEQVARQYPDGRADILARGEIPFEVIEFHPKPEQEEAHRAEVQFIAQDDTSSVLDREALLGQYAAFQKVIHAGAAPMPDVPLLSFAIGHTAGLSDAEKVDLLRTPDEQSRIEMLLEHFARTLPRLQAIEKTREKAQQNGDYRLFPELKLNFGKLS